MVTPMSQTTFFRHITLTSPFCPIPLPTIPFTGQVIILTGANSGIGFEAAKHIVHLGAAKVILGVRDTKKGQDAAEEVLKSTGATRDVVEVWELDLSRHESIKAFVELAEKLERLDAVLNNAGIATGTFRMVEGDEVTIRVNTIGTVSLGLLLLPKLRENADRVGMPSRLAFTGSESYLVAQLKEADIEGSLLDTLRIEEVFKANLHNRYMNSKLLLLYATRALAARLPSNVIITTITPGLCWSGLYRELPWFILPFFWLFMSIFARSAEVGGRTLVDALRPDLEKEKHGAFMMDCEVRKDLGPSVESPSARKIADEFVEELFARLEEIFPGVTSVLDWVE